MVKETNFEKLIKIVGLLSAIYLFLQGVLPIIQNLLAEGITGLILIGIFIWWLLQES